MAQPMPNRLILGTMTIGPSVEKGARITSLSTYKQCLEYLSKKGYNELDTAAIYVGGTQESFTRDADYSSYGYSVASKVYPTEAGDHSPERLRKKWEACLERLGAQTCGVDIMYLHAPDRATPYEATLEACNQLYKEGKFKRLGLSNFTAWEVAEMVGICERRGFVKPSVYQGMYNAITRAVEAELVPCLRKFNISLIIYNPLAAGLFSGKYTTLSQPESGRFSNANPLGDLYRSRYFKQSAMDALAIVEPVASRHNIPLIEVALRWCVHHSGLNMANKGGNDGIVLGISDFEQLVQNVEACEKGELPEEVAIALDKAWDKVKGEAPTYWR